LKQRSLNRNERYPLVIIAVPETYYRLVDFLLHARPPKWVRQGLRLHIFYGLRLHTSGTLPKQPSAPTLPNQIRSSTIKPNWDALTNFSSASQFWRHHVQIANVIKSGDSADIYSQCVLIANKFANIGDFCEYSYSQQPYRKIFC
jgi:hypothetical protein